VRNYLHIANRKEKQLADSGLTTTMDGRQGMGESETAQKEHKITENKQNGHYKYTSPHIIMAYDSLNFSFQEHGRNQCSNKEEYGNHRTVLIFYTQSFICALTYISKNLQSTYLQILTWHDPKRKKKPFARLTRRHDHEPCKMLKIQSSVCLYHRLIPIRFGSSNRESAPRSLSNATAR